MIKLQHSTLVFISGLVWLAIGGFLLQLGLNLVIGAAQINPLLSDNSFPLINSFAPIIGGRDQAAVFIIAISLIIGHFKGRYVLGKAAKKGIDRIATFPNPTSLANIYGKRYYILIAAMILLGVLIKVFHLPSDIRGLIDTAIGAALINGALLYFRVAYDLRKKQQAQAH